MKAQSIKKIGNLSVFLPLAFAACTSSQGGSSAGEIVKTQGPQSNITVQEAVLG